MPENFDILKYQFPPPGAVLCNQDFSRDPQGTSERPVKTARLSILWTQKIPEQTALVLRSVMAAYTYLDAAILANVSYYSALLRHSKISLLFNVADTDVILDVNALNYISLPAYSRKKIFNLIAPIPVMREVAGTTGFPGPGPAKWEGPIALGGPRTVCLAHFCSYLFGAPGNTIGLVNGAVDAWLVPDAERVWENSFK